MAPKKRKAAVETVDLAEDSGDDYVPTPKQPKRRRAASSAAGADDAPKKGGRKKASAAAQEEAGGSGAAATSAAAAAVVAAAAAAAGGAGVFGSQPAAAGGRKAPKSKKQSARDDARLDARVDAAGRAVSFRPTANQDVRDRIARAMPGSAHRMFLVESRQVAAADAPGGPEQEFHVLGATGNVYVVHIGTQPACTCPDFAKRAGLCKHILFVMLRVLRQDRLDPVIWQRALTIREAQRVLSVFNGGGAGGAGVVDQSVLANERLRKRYADIVHGGAAGGEGAGEEAGGAAGKKGVQRPVEGDCPICCEEMHAGGPAKEAVTFCGLCGNNMHKECFGRWAASKRSNRQPVTCVYCRANWQEGGGAAGGGAAAAGGGTPGGADGQYVNLSQFSDDHRRGASLTDLYGTGAYFMMANAGQMSRREAARMYAAERGWE
ncbi:hypothetical protein CHLRE_09g393550v5 [Chlamydomonas reinhardtii]|uniref:SWIM-type domain-containing protein n=1 Tax=Chlamydomonas reinhardtii TaxID=3055 RepID=A8IZU8_CHLRE|nr:uncharacterized protein CHLRE_09g393550v5 [Chlamydomonas reinhardtii]PNW78529.1 hypothetical protein CHLRE_09g393550v5 [Chlamydomonas reinhardtii]|eukprot:XP_001694472.1 predicted protein [Chlamydomonas reinhardtii]